MTTEELQTFTRKLLDFGIHHIRTHGELKQQFHLIFRDGSVDMMLLGGDVSNSEAAKSALAQQIKHRVRTEPIEAVIMLSDIFWASLTREKSIIVRRLRMNVEEASAFGLCEKHEAVVATLESPILCQWIRQEYRRDGDGSKIELIGEPVAFDDTGENRITGRFAGYFTHTRSSENLTQ